MRKHTAIAVIQVLVSCTLAFAQPPQGGQEPARPITVSPLIGDTLRPIERKLYHLFPDIDGFQWAVFYLNPDSSLKARITTLQDGILQGHVVPHYYQLRMLQDHVRRINEEIGEMWQGSEEDLLPFAMDSSANEANYPQFAFGIGVTVGSMDLDRLDVAFTSIETRYRNQGYQVLYHGKFSQSLVRWFNLKLQFSYSFALLLDAGTSVDDGPDFHAVSVSALYYFRPEESHFLKPFAGVGVGHYHLSVRQGYGAQVSPLDAYNGYTVLDEVNSEAGGTGFTFMGGLELDLGSGVALSAYANYLLIPAMETKLSTGEPVTLNMSRLALGGRIMIYF